MGTHREYTDDERVEAVGLSLAIGPTRAARQLGIPVRTVTNWTHHAQFAWMTSATRERLDGLLAHTVQVALEEVERSLKNPRVSLRQKAKALEIVGRQAEFMKMAAAWADVSKLLGDVK